MARIEPFACRCLRTKGMFIPVDRDPEVPDPSDRIYWCLHTMNQLGPDGEVAEPAACTSGRGCFRAR